LWPIPNAGREDDDVALREALPAVAAGTSATISRTRRA
jgi:hypothetical protein